MWNKNISESEKHLLGHGRWGEADTISQSIFMDHQIIVSDDNALNILKLHIILKAVHGLSIIHINGLLMSKQEVVI